MLTGWWRRRSARAARPSPAVVIDALFERYFVRGGNIGDATVLAEVRAECAISPRDAVEAAAPVADGMHGVPYFRFNDTLVVEGAQPPALLVEAMLEALSPIR